MSSRFYETQNKSLDFQQLDVGGDLLLRRAVSSLSAEGTTGEVDPVLFNNLVEMVPLVQSLIESKANNSFRRRGSMVYTKTPSRESLYQKAAGKSTTAANKKDRNMGSNNQDVENCFMYSSKGLLSDEDRVELLILRGQVEDLKKQISDKDELLKSTELSNDEISSIRTKYDKLMKEVAHKESLIKSAQLQLSDAKMKLADKQTAVEKLEWESMTSKNEVEKLDKELDSAFGEISSFICLIRGLTSDSSDIYPDDYDDIPYLSDQNDVSESEKDLQKLEEAREAYNAAVIVAKEKQDEESIAAAANARLYLQSIVFKQS